MRTQASSQQQIVSRTEAQRSARESASSDIRSRATDDQQRFSEGFVAGWYSLMGYRGVPTIIPDCEIPMGKSPFEHGTTKRAPLSKACKDTRPIRVLNNECLRVEAAGIEQRRARVTAETGPARYLSAERSPGKQPELGGSGSPAAEKAAMGVIRILRGTYTLKAK
jgi:hypothetical protein